MYTGREDSIAKAIRIVEGVSKPPRTDGKTYRHRGLAADQIGFNQAKQLILAALKAEQDAIFKEQIMK